MNFREYLKEKGVSLLKVSKETGIPYSTLVTAIEKPESMRVENLIKLSQYLDKNLDEVFNMLSQKKEKTLAQILKEQKDMKLKGNLYHFTQIKFAYNTNRIEGSRLSEDETRFIFETNTLIPNGNSQNVDDVVETANHFGLFDALLDRVDHILSEDLIKDYHRILKSGTEDSRKDWFNVGEYKTLPNEVGGQETTKPKDVGKEMRKLLINYNSIDEIKLKDIIEFHYRFEKIHPFQDGNGRVGRAIMFKECLRNNVVPFIIEDSFKAFYYRGLSKYEEEKGFLEETCLAMQDNYKEVIKRFLQKFDF